MTDALFDTTVFVDYRRGVSEAGTLITSVIDKRITASYSPLTVLELWQGDMRDRKEEMEWEALFTLMEEAKLSHNASRTAGSKLRPYNKNQKAEYFADALIAATAEERNEPLYTRNHKHMKLFYGRITRY